MKLKDILIKKGIVSEEWKRDSEVPTLSLEDKKIFMEKVRNYSSYGKAIYSEHDLVEIADDLAEIADKAEIYTLSETNDAFDKITIGRNIKELKGLSANFTKVASEAKSLKERMSGLYEDMGNILNRYFEIQDADILDEDQAEFDRKGHEHMNTVDIEKKKSQMYDIIHSSDDEDEIEWAKKELEDLK